MVGFGAVLDRSRRQLWGNAYLDYEGLKAILNRLNDAVVDNSARLSVQVLTKTSETTPAIIIDEDVRRYSSEFMSKLHSEIEKVTLFCLSRLGDLAHSLGALRFDDDQDTLFENPKGDVENAAVLDRAENGSSRDQRHDVFQSNGMDTHEEEEWRCELGERDSLLPVDNGRRYNADNGQRYNDRPSSLWRSNVNHLFHSEILSIRERSNDSNDKFGVYAKIGVELLHLLKFATLNAVGIRKIVKKYEKTFLAHPFVREKGVSEVDLDENSSHDRLLNLTGNWSFNSIYASLVDALAECDTAVMKSIGTSRSHRRGLSVPFHRSREAAIQFLKGPKDANVQASLSLLQLECTVLSINAIQDFANSLSKPFHMYLYRKAMIGRGKDKGDLGSSNKKAIDVLVSFEPQFILEMSERELTEWCQRAAAKTAGQKSHFREPSSDVDNPLLMEDRDWGGVDNASLIINLVSVVLYTINYYIISPTANSYAILLGTEGAYGATLIGASSFAALFSALLYSVWYTRFSFRSALIFSAICPLVGNVLYSFAITYNSMKLALFGRFLCGFGSAEVANRQLISNCVSIQSMTRACALFVTASAIGMSIGPLLAAIIDMTAGRDEDVDLHIHLPWSPPESGVILDHVTVPGFLMAFLWGVQLICLVFVFEEPQRINTDMSDNDSNYSTKTDRTLNSITSFYQVIFKNGAFPTTLYLFAFIEMTGEIMISSCSMVVHRYFRWHGSMAGFIIASLGALVLPAHVIVERACHVYSERHILRWSMICVTCSIIAIFNYEGLALDVAGYIVEGTRSKYAFVKRLKQYVTSLSFHKEFPYDWDAGVYVYLFSLSAMFISTIVMEGVNTSLMSQTTPKELNNSFINMGLLATVVGTIGRVFGDSMITACAFFGRSELHDFVSVTFAPLLPLLLVGWYLIRRHYKFLV